MNHSNRRKGILKARRLLRVWRGQRGHIGSHNIYADNGRVAQRLLYTRTLCSCSMCGNPRRHFGEKTRQELLAEEEEVFESKEESHEHVC